MKPRLDVLPQTQEDWTIFCDFVERTRMPIIALSESQDRRDAELMWKAQRERDPGHWGWITRYIELEPDTYRYDWFGGALRSAKAVNPRAAGDIRYFA